MTIARIGEVQAKEEKTRQLQEFLISVLPSIRSSEGCESVQLYQSQEDPEKFMVIEIWDSVESHQASVKNISPELLGEIRLLLASSPSGAYYNLVEEK